MPESIILIPACPSLPCSFDSANIKRTSSAKICVLCLCMCVYFLFILFFIRVGIGFVEEKSFEICICLLYDRVWLS